MMYTKAQRVTEGLHMRLTVFNSQDQVVGTAVSQAFGIEAGTGSPLEFTFRTKMLTEGEYSADIALVEPLGDRQIRHAFVRRAMAFRIESRERIYQTPWFENAWGSVCFDDLEVKIKDENS